MAQPLGNRFLVDLLILVFILPDRCDSALFQLHFDSLLNSFEHQRRQLIMKFDQTKYGFDIKFYPVILSKPAHPEMKMYV
ncbi:hypothetical protein D3C87_2054730 [compost metagenome]